jgi:hypothetical protein
MRMDNWRIIIDSANCYIPASMRILEDPRITATGLPSQLLLIEVGYNAFSESGIATELEGL